MPRQANRLALNQKLQLNASLATAIRVLRLDASGLTRYLEEQAGENPYLIIAPPPMEPGQWLPRWTTAFAARGMGQSGGHDIGERMQAPALGLIAHVTRQIEQMIRPGRDRDIAFAMMEALEPSGWLGRPLASIAAESGCSLPEAEHVLQRLQQIEPTGLFARNLSECLRLQAAEAEQLDEVMICVLGHLELLASGEVARLARMCSVPIAEILQRLRIIRGFHPKPGTEFGQDAGPVREPDLTVVREASGWRVSLNRSALPDVTINPAKRRAEEDSKALAHAREVLRLVENRNQTLLRIAEEILSRQHPVLTRGMEALVPMTMQDVGKALDLHASTVSRAIAGVSVDAPRGTIWLRALFTAALGDRAEDRKAGTDAGETDRTGGTVAAGAVRARLLALVRAENPATPLSDQMLAEALSTPQARVARRTIAKYRDLLDIPPAYRRRRR